MATTRTNRKPAPRATDKPRITGLDIEKIQREGAPDEPYRAPLRGRIITFNDPLELDWQDSVQINPNNAVAVLRSLLSEEDWDHFKNVRMPGWRLVELFKDIQRYYGAAPEDEGNELGSPTS